MSVLTTSALAIEASMKDISLAQVPCIHYPIQFWKGSSQVQAFFDSGSEVNAMNPAYAEKLGLRMRKTNVGTQKIDGSSLDTFGMVITSFQVQDKLRRARFFQETFLVADTRMDVVLGMPFLILSNANIQFVKGDLT